MSVVTPSSVGWVAVLTALVTLHQAAGTDLRSFLLNRDLAEIQQFPGVVSLQYNKHHFCGGTLIAPRWVLTAAHCLYEVNAKFISVLMGSVHNAVGEEGININIEQTVVHEDYTGNLPRNNDIGAIKLSRTAPLSTTIQLMTLQSRVELTAMKGVVVGWGQTLDWQDTVNPNLQFATIEVIPNLYCQLLYEGYATIDDSQFCAANLRSTSRSRCMSDTGGPFLVDGVQVGIVSWGRKPCEDNESPEVFTRIAAHWRWIQHTTGVHPTRPSWDRSSDAEKIHQLVETTNVE